MDPAGPVENAPRFPPALGQRSRAVHRLHRPDDRSPEPEPDTIRDAVKLGGVDKSQMNVAPLR